MSGLVKAKKYDWKDSNVAMFGSDTDRQVKKESAETEPAWAGAGQEVGLKIWRIVKFQVTEWPKEDYGSFYSGDSYIILNTYQEEGSDELLYDVHFWIGKHSTQDEYGTAAYKTVELDTLLDDRAIQHREVMGAESDLFRSYFQKVSIMRGGADTGFRHVTPEEYKPRLLQFNGKGRNITCTEVPLSKNRLNPDDVFILDMGVRIFQWNGEGSNGMERIKAAQFVQQLESDHKGTSEVIDAGDSNSDFDDALNEEDEVEEDENDGAEIKELYRVSDASGELVFDKIKESEVSMADFASNAPRRSESVSVGCLSCVGSKRSKKINVSEDVFILDTGKTCFVWVGSEASPAEKKNGLGYATKYLSGTGHPCIPLHVIREGQKSTDFDSAIAA